MPLGEDAREVARLWVTASGGPFRGRTRAELADITPAQALAHPTWNMGAKITIDSSTLMNKGLEVIEAHHLFAMPYDRISVVVQPQSAIHSMVEFADGSVKAHLGTTDMRIPIQFALRYPERWDAPVAPLDFRTLGALEFAAPDEDTFRCLALARAAGERGGTLPCVMNAANEVAVAAFLAGEGTYLGIAACVEAVMDAHEQRRRRRRAARGKPAAAGRSWTPGRARRRTGASPRAQTPAARSAGADAGWGAAGMRQRHGPAVRGGTPQRCGVLACPTGAMRERPRPPRAARARQRRGGGMRLKKSRPSRRRRLGLRGRIRGTFPARWQKGNGR